MKQYGDEAGPKMYEAKSEEKFAILWGWRGSKTKVA